MKTMKLETLEVAYNEKHNEIRLLVNSYSTGATLFTLNANNLSDFLENISRPETHKVTMVAQPLKKQSFYSLGMDETVDGFDEELYGFIYHANNDDLSEYFTGETSPVALLLENDDRSMIERELWELGQILDYVMG